METGPPVQHGELLPSGRRAIPHHPPVGVVDVVDVVPLPNQPLPVPVPKIPHLSFVIVVVRSLNKANERHIFCQQVRSMII